MRLIDADALIRKFKTASPMAIDGRARQMVEEMPTIEPERKKGRWIEYDNSHCECPFCHEEWSYFDNDVERFNYCPNCGCHMKEGEEHD